MIDFFQIIVFAQSYQNVTGRYYLVRSGGDDNIVSPFDRQYGYSLFFTQFQSPQRFACIDFGRNQFNNTVIGR